MKIEKHCQACRERFGRDFREVHEWLDFYDSKKGTDEKGEYDYTGRNAIKHRERRHHIEGIKQCIEFFGPPAGQAAQLHIAQDFYGYIPEKNDYLRNDFWQEMAERENNRVQGFN